MNHRIGFEILGAPQMACEGRMPKPPHNDLPLSGQSDWFSHQRKSDEDSRTA